MLSLTFGERYPAPCALVLGGFDGLHLGHRALLEEAKRSDLPVGVTTIFGGKGKALFTREERRYLFSAAGVDLVIEIPFTEAVRETSAEDFLRILSETLSPRLFVCGEDFRFGKGAAGTPQLLRSCAVPVAVVKTVKDLAGESGRPRKISTSACKSFLRSEDLPRLNACLCARSEDLLGSGYFVQGEVGHGREVGRTYGFPTLNLPVPAEKLLPPDGVYGGLCATPEGNFPCILNLGARPTFGVQTRLLEAHLDGFSGDLYGKTVRVYPMEYYRPIRKFSGAEALRAQLKADIGRLRERNR